MDSTKTRSIDFGDGPITATRMAWGDIFTAWYSTSIPNIEDYLVIPEATRRQLAMMASLSPFFKLAAVRNFFRRAVKPGATADERAWTITHVWGEVTDDQGRRAVSRLTGPEGGVTWTGRAALAVVQKVLAGNVAPGFQTPARAYGADLVLECEGVTREDLES